MVDIFLLVSEPPHENSKKLTVQCKSSALALLQNFLESNRYCLHERPVVPYHGLLNKQERSANLKRMMSAENMIALTTYSMGGVSLNLQSFNAVYLLDRHWNPTVSKNRPQHPHTKTFNR